jgi:hypothetical protein
MILLMLSVFTQIWVKVNHSIPLQICGPSQICNAQMMLLPHSGLSVRLEISFKGLHLGSTRMGHENEHTHKASSKFKTGINSLDVMFN